MIQITKYILKNLLFQVMLKIKMKQFLSLKTSEDNSCKEYGDGGYAKCVDDKVHQVIHLHSNLKHKLIIVKQF